MLFEDFDMFLADPLLAGIARQSRRGDIGLYRNAAPQEAVLGTWFQPAIASQAGCGAKRWIETLVLLIVTKLDGGIACQSPPSRSSGSETMQRPRPSRTAAV